jgi:hypothetical protein
MFGTGFISNIVSHIIFHLILDWVLPNSLKCSTMPLGDLAKKKALEAKASQKKVTFAILEGPNSMWITKSSSASKM